MTSSPVTPDAPARSPLHRLAALLWRLLVLALLLLAAWTLLARALTASAGAWKDEVLAAANARLPFQLEARSLSGSLRGFSPEFHLEGLTLRPDATGESPLTLASGRLRLDPLRSLLTLSPQVSDLRLEGLSLHLVKDEAGRLRLQGLPAGTGLLRRWLTRLLSQVDALVIDDGRLRLGGENGAEPSRASLSLALLRRGSARTIDTQLVIEDNRLRLHASGVGDPLALATWRGDVYLKLQGRQLERLQAWVPRGDLPLAVSGGGTLEAWLNRAGDGSDLVLRTRAEDLVIREAEDSWSLPLSSLAMNASLARESGGWRLVANELALAHGERQWQVDRAQFRLTGDSLQARLAGMRLDGIEHLMAAAPASSEGLRAALAQLHPRGTLSAAQLSVDDVRAPGRNWRLAARLQDAAVDSWRGAPGVEGLDALVRLGPGHGEIILDSSDIALSFPSVYSDALRYAALDGALQIDWGPDAVSVDSGLITARAAEGRASALLNLNFPRQGDDVVGPSMQLMVGLRDSDARHRAKYLPITLPQTVRDWLADAIMAGRIRDGAFLWRGSLRREAAAQRTVQLAFDVASADLRFDPSWPPLEDFAGLVLIDDRQLSVWADRGRLDGAVLSHASAEMDRTARGETRLQIAARADADADAALGIIRDSPLVEITGGALSGWRARGPLQAALSLGLSLSEPASPPEVALDARLDDVALDLRPGDLPLRGVSGDLQYRSQGGFAGSRLQGSLWGETLSARVESGEAELNIELGGTLAGEPLMDWLGLSRSALLSGRAPVSGALVFARGEAPHLSLRSDLEGLGIDLPPPWGKDGDAAMPLAVDLELARDATAVNLQLQDALALELGLVDGRVVDSELRLQSDWLQAAYDPDASPQLLIDWLDLSGLRQAALSDDARETTREEATDKVETTGLARLFELLEQSPDTQVEVLELRRDGTLQGHLGFRFSSESGTLHARAVQGEVFGLRSDGEQGGGTELRWSRGPDGDDVTALDIDIAFSDLGAVFESLGYVRSIESRRGSAVGSLRWQGTPSQPRFAALEGTLQLQARDGRLLQSPGAGASGALKVLSLLNLAELLQGLSLASMFESGIPFQEAASDLVFNAGQLRIPSLTLDGAASAFRFSGTTNLAAVDGELVVTLPVANNLPWVAALAAGLPVAAGVFVVSKVFEKQVERMSSGVYSVTGPLESPRVRLKRIFDNQSNPSQSAPSPAESSATEAVPESLAPQEEVSSSRR
jgi:uncharacterized protein YhdP